jgi:DNA-binding beta-propeller fold protein YncE
MRPVKFIVPLLLLLATIASGAPPPELRQVAIIDLPGRPGFDELAFAKNMLVMTHAGAGTVDIFDPTKRRLIAHVKDMGKPRGIAVDEQGGRVYIGDAGTNSVVVLNMQDWQVLQSIPLKHAPDSLFFLPEAHAVFVVYGAAQAIGVIDTAAQSEVRTVQLDGHPEYLADDPGRKLLYVTLQDKKQVVALDRQMKVTKRFELTASQPTGIAYDAKLDRIYVAVRYAVLSLNADNGSENARVPAPGGIDALWFDDAGERLFAAAGGSVFVMRTSGKLVADYEVATEVRGHTLAFDPQKKMVYMPGGREGRSKLLIMRQIGSGNPAGQTQSADAQKKQLAPNQ